MPEINHDSELGLDHDPNFAPNPSDEPLSIEEGDRILATGLLPPLSLEI